MKYFIFTFEGDGFPIAYKLQQEGHEVIVGQVEDKADIHADSETNGTPEDPRTKRRRLKLFDGMVLKMPAWDLVEKIKKLHDKSDCFVFFDKNSLFRFAEALTPYDLKGNFPTEEDYLLEQDRDMAKEFVRKNYPKLHVAPIYDFESVEAGKEFLEKTEEVWVLKGKNDKAKTVIPDVNDPQLAARQLMQALKSGKEVYEEYGYVLELMISSLIELTPEKIYYDGVPVALTVDIENKPFGSGNTSIQTGCAQGLTFPISFDERINDIAFPPIIDELAKKRKGLFYWDASLLVDKRTGKIYFGEFCSNRPGYNSVFEEIAQCPSVHHYFSSIAQQKSPFTLGTVACSVTIFNPSTDDDAPDHPPKDDLIDFKPELEKDLWLWDAYKDGDSYVTAGYDWNLAVITGTGKSIDDAVNRMYRNVEEFSFVGSYNRPKFDYVSLDYPTSIPNRLNYGIDRGLFTIPFNVKVGDLKATM